MCDVTQLDHNLKKIICLFVPPPFVCQFNSRLTQIYWTKSPGPEQIAVTCCVDPDKETEPETFSLISQVKTHGSILGE